MRSRRDCAGAAGEMRERDDRGAPPLVRVRAAHPSRLCCSASHRTLRAPLVLLAPPLDSFVKFSGFPASAYGPLHQWLSQSGVELVVEKMTTRGANWGFVKVDSHRILFEDPDGLTVFDVPMSAIAQTVVAGKHDVSARSDERAREKGENGW
jgi:hypothetical protein